MKVIDLLKYGSGYHSRLIISKNFYGLGIIFRRMAVHCEWIIEIDLIFIRFWIGKDAKF